MTPAPAPTWLVTPRLRLRRPTAADARRLFEIHTHPDTYHHAPSAVMRDESEAAERLEVWRLHWDEHGFGYAVVETLTDGDVVGYAGVWDVTLAGYDALNLYYRFDPARWGRGLATEAARAVLDEVTPRLPDRPVVARIARTNKASARVAERLGLRRDLLQDPDDPVPHWVYSTAPLDGWMPEAT